MQRVAFHTLGCKLNAAETGMLERDFRARHFEVVPFGAPADVVVVNTCSVTAEADRKCRQVVRRAHRANPGACVVVTGCYAQLQPDEVAALPGVDVVLGAEEKFRLFDVVDAFTKRETPHVAVSCVGDAQRFGPAYSSESRTRATLKVQDGCDYTCAFCTIPLARGRSRSQPVADCVDQARTLVDEGFREIVLSGVNLGLFGSDQDTDLLSLLRALDAVDGVARYRISSIEPNLLTDAIIDFVAESRAFVPHFHLPLQSGDDAVLGKMRRRYRRSVYEDRVARILNRMPDAAIGADVIVGFPAEDAARFETTCAFLTDLPVAYLHVFTYSERPDTVAVDARECVGGATVSKAERSRRNRRLRLLSEKKRHAFYATHRATVRTVLWEQADEDGVRHGLTDNYIRVRRGLPGGTRGALEPVRLDGFAEDGALIGNDLSLPIL